MAEGPEVTEVSPGCSGNDEAAECIIDCVAFFTRREKVERITGPKINSDVVLKEKKDGLVS